MIRAKVIVQSKKTHRGYNGSRGYEIVEMSPVSSKEIPEDKRFAEATPSGKIELTMKPDVADRFDFGKAYYVDFTEAPAEDSGSIHT